MTTLRERVIEAILAKMDPAPLSPRANQAAIDRFAGYRQQAAEKFADAALAAMLPEWLPIESAPRDGTEILAIDKNGWADVVSWQQIAPTVWGFYTTDGGSGFLTHWMPIPEPPKEDAR